MSKPTRHRPLRLDQVGEAVSPIEFARLLELSESGARELIASGQVRAVRIGRTWRVPRVEVERLLGVESDRSGAPQLGVLRGAGDGRG